jgi:ABC-type Mn2+/Zn2+ transport system ATPase subunit
LSNGFGDDFNAYAKQMLEKAVSDGIAAIGITDYFTIDGYKAVRTLLDDSDALKKLVGEDIAAKAATILFLPNIELRTSIIIRDPKGADSRVNFHVIFADTLSIEDIEDHFLRELKFTAESNPDSKDERWPLTARHLAELGKRLKEQHEGFHGRSDVFIGMMNAVVDHSEVSEILENKPSIFKDRYLLCLPCDEDLSKCSWDGQGHLARKVLIQKSHALFSANESTRAFALGKKHTSPVEFETEFKSFKPCIHSSDAHKFEELFAPDKDRFTWIEADPTFYGLRQTLNEPEDRVYIGEVPPSLARAMRRATRVMRAIEIRKLSTATTSERWFDCLIPLNSELVAVIGNKGSGKSALSDIIGLLGNTPRFGSFSFLTSEKFRRSRNNKSRQFTASLHWADGTVDSVANLDVNPSPDDVEKVKYIPQTYLEDICNEVGAGKGGQFYNELQQVIFSHVAEADKLGFATLDELLAHRSEETNHAIAQYVTKLEEINSLIVATEEQALPHHRKAIEAQLAEKNRELGANQQTRPSEVKKPEADPAAQQQTKTATQELEKKQAELKLLETEIAELRASDLVLAKRKSVGEKLIGKLTNLDRQLQIFADEAKDDLAELKLEIEDVVTFRVDRRPVEGVIETIDRERATIAEKLSSDKPGSVEQKRRIAADAITSLQAQLSAPQRAYQAYLTALTEWEKARMKLIGDEEAVGSQKYLEKQLRELSQIPSRLKTLRSDRDRKLLEIFREKQRLRQYYETYYGAVQTFLDKHPLAANEQFRLTFNVSMAQSGFAEAFLGKLNRRKFGCFMGDEEGAGEMKRLLDGANFDSALGTLRFIKTLFKRLSEREGRQLLVKDQLRQGVTVNDLYNFVFSLGFLSPIYNLQWDGKGLEQLSPGERGNLLLIFYLLVDRDDIPLVIDQPEENLDNHTVFKTLVPCIKDAKKRRQIVVVTHNPNLAVVCDAEQIICAEIRKDRANTVTYMSGSIEDPIINRRIVDILEGTRPAFDRRDDKYLV